MSAEPIVAALAPHTTSDTAAERLAALFDNHHERLYRLARRLTPSTDDARDLVQETYLRAARAPNSVPAGFTDGQAWLVRVLINIRQDHWRRTAVRQVHANSLRGELRSLPSSPEAAFVARDRRRGHHVPHGERANQHIGDGGRSIYASGSRPDRRRNTWPLGQRLPAADGPSLAISR